jgi:hypothetical protein
MIDSGKMREAQEAIINLLRVSPASGIRHSAFGLVSASRLRVSMQQKRYRGGNKRDEILTRTVHDAILKTFPTLVDAFKEVV